LVLVIVGEKYGADQEVGVTDGRMIRVTVVVGVSVSVMMTRIVTVCVGEAVGENAAGGSSISTVEVGLYMLKPGKKGVFEGGRKAFQSSADPCLNAPGIDPVIREQPKISTAAASQNILGTILAGFMSCPWKKTNAPSLSMNILWGKEMTKILFWPLR
jgi:hypothetical protein